MYEPGFFRAGRTLGRDEAVELVASGRAVTVAVPDEDLMGMGDLKVTVTTGSTPGGDPCAHGAIQEINRLDAGDLEVYAAVMAAAASLCSGVNAVLLARELAGA